jgi:hypothetical protein
MLVIPQTNPVLRPLNSYYVDIKKLVEHYQGDIGSGAVHLKSFVEEGCLFFDKDEILNGVFRDKFGEITGDKAVSLILNKTNTNCEIHIYAVSTDHIYFWADAPNATVLYDALNSEFTNFGALVKKMSVEKLTGYIYITFTESNEYGYVFLINGKIVSSFYSKIQENKGELKKNLAFLTEETRKKSSVFQIKKIIPNRKKENKNQKGLQNLHGNDKESRLNVVPFLEEVLYVLENIVSRNKKIKTDFNLILRNKFLEKAERYPFLDPFALQFEYANKSINIAKGIDQVLLLESVSESVREIADELKIRDLLRAEINTLQGSYPEEILNAGL